ncbi:ubiquitin-conjugating enzyme E2 S-like [Ornithodoros turicata]|uniref:E2 ubiquitin-conjugating enzyme n=1 Tax=Ornithodoros turicata TaxID=34597 RepID=A0A2R5LLK5_9ACAR
MSRCSNVENVSPQVLKKVSKELHELVQNPPEGIRVHLNEEDITQVEATIEGPPATPYAGGLFKVRLVLPKEYPALPPRGFFVTRIFHPNVAVPSGEICVDTLKKDWKPDVGIGQILLTIKCLLIVPNPESALNEDAGRMLLQEYQEYCQRARMMTEIHARPAKHKAVLQQPQNKDRKRMLKRL